MKKKILLLLFCVVQMGIFGVELDFETEGKKRVYLLAGGRVRINEEFDLDDFSKEITLNNFSDGIKRESVIVENEEVEDIIFSITSSKEKETGSYYIGREIKYDLEKYTLLSLNPLIIERNLDGKVVINPKGELIIEPLEDVIRGNTLKIMGKTSMNALNLSYEYEKFNWKRVYNLNLDDKSLEKMVILKNNTDRKLEDIQLSYGKEESLQLSIDPYVEKKVDLWKKEIKVEKKYLYRVSKDNAHPHVKLKVDGEQLEDGTGVRIIEKKRYIGDMVSLEKDGVINFSGLIDDKVDITKEDNYLKFGEKFSRNSVEVSIKNYKKESVFLEVVYDELPEKWYEMKSEIPYEVDKGEVVFQLVIPANSRKKVNFSYIMEKI